MKLRKRKAHEFEVDGAAFTVDRALGSAESFDVVKRALDLNGRVSTVSLLAAFVTGWDGIEDEAGEPLSFQTDRVGLLPVDVAEALAEQILERHGEEAARSEKCLGESSGSASSAESAPDGASPSSDGS